MSYTFIPANPAHTGGANGTITRVVIHGTVSPCVRGGAKGNAHYFQSASAGGSAHYVVDPAEVVCCVHEDTVAYHAPPNHGSIGVELCDPQSGDPHRWADPDHEAMLHVGAALVADLCLRHALPVVKLSSKDLLAGKRGICGHDDVSQAWHESDHSDPNHGGAFPWAHFLDLVKAHVAGNPPKPPAGKTYPTLKQGDRGPDVKRLQQLLHVTADGVFGKDTTTAVKHTQATHHLTQDGVAGKATLSALGW